MKTDKNTFKISLETPLGSFTIVTDFIFETKQTKLTKEHVDGLFKSIYKRVTENGGVLNDVIEEFQDYSFNLVATLVDMKKNEDNE